METTLAIDLGGTKILVGEVTKTGEILNSYTTPSKITEMDSVVKQICTAIDTYMETYDFIGTVTNIGVGLVGRVNYHTGIWYEIHPELVGPIDMKTILEKRYNIPTFIGNDVFCATLAELNFGIGQQTKDFIYMNIGTGIAARLVCDGKIITGHSYDAGEIGHTVANSASDVQCICGRKGCVEVLASGLGMHNRAIALLPEFPETSLQKPENEQRISVKELMAAYIQADALAVKVVEEATTAVAETLMNLIRVADPAAIVLGGGVVNADVYFEKIKEKLHPKTIRFLEKGVTRTTLDVSHIALLGASQLHLTKN